MFLGFVLASNAARSASIMAAMSAVRGGRTSCDPAGDSLTPGCRKVIAAGNKVVDGVRLERFTRLHWPAMQNKLQRGFRSHPFPGAHRPAITGKKTEIDLGKAELAGRIVNGNDGVECQRKFKTATDADPCLLYTSPSPRDLWISRMPSSA